MLQMFQNEVYQVMRQHPLESDNNWRDLKKGTPLSILGNFVSFFKSILCSRFKKK